MPQHLPRSFVLILTATISPKGDLRSSLVRANPDVRVRDYEDGLRFWLSLDVAWLSGIVFAENSNAALQSLRKIAAQENPFGRHVEFLSYDQPPPPEGLHYGYSELVLVSNAVRDSRLLPSATHFIKCTGRYRFPQIDRLIKRIPADFRVALDTRATNPFSAEKNLISNFALALFETDFFNEHVAPLSQKMIPAPPWNRSQFIEPVLFDNLSPLRNDSRVILRWPVNCEPSGVGSNGDNYAKASKRIKSSIRAVARVALPNVWI